MSDLRKPGCDDPILIEDEDEDDPRYDGQRRTLGQLGSGV